MEKWNGDVLDVNKTIAQLGPSKCSQLLGLHALSGCDTVSYPFGKGKKSALKLLEIDIGLDQVLGQPGATHAQLKATADSFFLPLYGQKSCTAMSDARTRFFRGRKKPPPLKKLPPTDANLQLHVLRAHLQMLLWKATGTARRNSRHCQLWLEHRWLHHHSDCINSSGCSSSTSGCSELQLHGRGQGMQWHTL